MDDLTIQQHCCLAAVFDVNVDPFQKMKKKKTCFYKADKRKIIYSAGGCETEIDFVLVGEKYRKHVSDVKVIPWELQHRLVVVDLDKKVVRKQPIMRKRFGS